MSENKCYDCGRPFYVSSMYFGPNRCPDCEKIKTIKAEGELNRNLHNQAIRALEAQQELIAEQNAMLERQTQIILESSTSAEDAYEIGSRYISDNFPLNNYLNLNLEVDERGEILAEWENAYVTPKLNVSFNKGLSDSVSLLKKANYVTLRASAYNAGVGHAEGSLDEYFSLNTGVEINGEMISTRGVFSTFSYDVDERTGELKFSWTPPFNSTDLNSCYASGVDSVYKKENSEDKKVQRVQAISDGKKARIIGWSSAIFVLLVVFFIWKYSWINVSGWYVFFINFLAIPVVTIVFIGYIISWVNERGFKR